MCDGAGFFSLSLSLWARRLPLEANTRAATAARIQRLAAAARVRGCTSIVSLMVRCSMRQSKSGVAAEVPAKSDSPDDVFMQLVPCVELMVCWGSAFPEAPFGDGLQHFLVGLSFEALGVFSAFVFRLPPDLHSGAARVAASTIFAIFASILSRSSFHRLGRQSGFKRARMRTPVDSHRLVWGGAPPDIRRFTLALLCTPLLTPWQWCIVSLGTVAAGNGNFYWRRRAAAGRAVPGKSSRIPASRTRLPAFSEVRPRGRLPKS